MYLLSPSQSHWPSCYVSSAFEGELWEWQVIVKRKVWFCACLLDAPRPEQKQPASFKWSDLLFVIAMLCGSSCSIMAVFSSCVMDCSMWLLPLSDHIISEKRATDTRWPASLAVKTEGKRSPEASETLIKQQCITSHVTEAVFQSYLTYAGVYLCHFMMGVCSHDLLHSGDSLWQGKDKMAQRHLLCVKLHVAECVLKVQHNMPLMI